MHGNSRLIVVLLLVAFVAAMSGMQAFASEPTSHPAGCHGPMPSAPSQAPVSYQCCANGHDWAMPNVQFSYERPLAQTVAAFVCDEASLSFGEHYHSPEPVFPSASPPRSSPLRI